MARSHIGLLDPPRLLVLVAVVMATGLSLALGDWSTPTPEGPNIVVIITDDQSWAAFQASPVDAMPFLHAHMEDPHNDWTRFDSAFISTSLCCPSRTTILSGQYAFNTGVLRNGDGALFRDDQTLATWLQARGYTTGLVGKYLNQYPFGREPFVPPGWDTWTAKIHGDASSVYYDYVLNQDGQLESHGHAPQDYMTDVLASEATRFIDHAPVWKPFFLYFSPTSPHAPWVPAPRYEGIYDDVQLPTSVSLGQVEGKPAWVQALPRMTQTRAAAELADRRRELEVLRATDDAVRDIVAALERDGQMNDTIILFISDNGYSYGEHNVTTKRCPYDECSRVPFAIRMPGAGPREVTTAVSNVDIAATLTDVVDARVTIPQDGTSLAPLIEGGSISRDGVLLQWAGDGVVPAFWALRTDRYLYVEYPASDERELYDSQEDPAQLHNLADDPSFRAQRKQLARELHELVPNPPPAGTYLGPLKETKFTKE